jgi:hypothetical protein
MLPDTRHIPGLGALVMLSFAGGLVCGVILMTALRPTRVVRFYSIGMPPETVQDCNRAADTATEGIH